ncbi:hypothetical protein T265_11498 [Opisthorchis viverrini]|uniref:Uncharacterized protein n=1 Tax=Opisthorchis viverrini TaxID=6198 RepID=A0A074Z2S7_OPIVI|nr:hypothetical protein T265_11498 [Opisthorchis viverrini]KER19817.1 hypothetical protein T265_11498 [Opisthorchis viverrini]
MKSIDIYFLSEEFILSLELCKQFAEEAYSIALHPTGLYILVGFSDKLRLMNLLIDDIRTFHEFPIRGCREPACACQKFYPTPPHPTPPHPTPPHPTPPHPTPPHPTPPHPTPPHPTPPHPTPPHPTPPHPTPPHPTPPHPTPPHPTPPHPTPPHPTPPHPTPPHPTPPHPTPPHPTPPHPTPVDQSAWLANQIWCTDVNIVHAINARDCTGLQTVRLLAP